MKIGPQQIWNHKHSDKTSLRVLEQVNEKYKVRINGPGKNIHMIEIVSPKYITTHYKYEKTEKTTKGEKS